MRVPRNREPMALGTFVLLVVSSLFLMGFVLSRGPALGLVLLILLWLALGLSAFRWGVDSRDSRDWDDRPAGPPVSPVDRRPGAPGGSFGPAPTTGD